MYTCEIFDLTDRSRRPTPTACQDPEDCVYTYDREHTPMILDDIPSNVGFGQQLGAVVSTKMATSRVN